MGQQAMHDGPHPHGSEDMSFISPQVLAECARLGADGPRRLVELVWFDGARPRNHNVKATKTDLKQGWIRVHNGADWDYDPCPDVVLARMWLCACVRIRDQVRQWERQGDLEHYLAGLTPSRLDSVTEYFAAWH